MYFLINERHIHKPLANQKCMKWLNIWYTRYHSVASINLCRLAYFLLSNSIFYFYFFVLNQTTKNGTIWLSIDEYHWQRNIWVKKIINFFVHSHKNIAFLPRNNIKFETFIGLSTSVSIQTITLHAVSSKSNCCKRQMLWHAHILIWYSKKFICCKI